MRRTALALALVLVSLFPALALAQARATGADLHGTVVDSSGAVLPGESEVVLVELAAGGGDLGIGQGREHARGIVVAAPHQDAIAVQDRIAHQAIKLQATEPAKQYLSDRGYNFEFGARPLRRVIQNEVEDVLSDGFLSGKFEKGDTVEIDLVEGNLTFNAVRPPKLETPTLRQEPEGEPLFMA